MASVQPTTGRVSRARQSWRSSLLSMTTTCTSLDAWPSGGLGIRASGGAERVEARGTKSRGDRAHDHAERPGEVEELEPVGRRPAEQRADHLLRAAAGRAVGATRAGH